MSTRESSPTPAVGQIWADNDPRNDGQELIILALFSDRAICRRGSRMVEIRLDRFKPTTRGYRFVREVTREPDYFSELEDSLITTVQAFRRTADYIQFMSKKSGRVPRYWLHELVAREFDRLPEAQKQEFHGNRTQN